MPLLGLTPMLTVSSIDEAVDFYCRMLGFRLLSSFPGWACISLDGVELMFSLPNEHVPFTRPIMTGSLYLKTDQVDAWWAKLKDICQVEYPLADFDYGMREFAIRDNFGYLLQFGQEKT